MIRASAQRLMARLGPEIAGVALPREFSAQNAFSGGECAAAYTIGNFLMAWSRLYQRRF